MFARSASTAIETSVVPVTRIGSGNFLPDLAKIRAGDISRARAAIATHISNHFEYYARERIMRLVLNYGEAASFARALRTRKIEARGLQ
jgi:hypothetical protein